MENKTRNGNRNILRDLTKIFGCHEKDLPRTLRRFKEEIAGIEKKIR